MVAARTLDFPSGKLLITLQVLLASGTFKLELAHKSFRFRHDRMVEQIRPQCNHAEFSQGADQKSQVVLKIFRIAKSGVRRAEIKKILGRVVSAKNETQPDKPVGLEGSPGRQQFIVKPLISGARGETQEPAFLPPVGQITKLANPATPNSSRFHIAKLIWSRITIRCRQCFWPSHQVTAKDSVFLEKPKAKPKISNRDFGEKSASRSASKPHWLGVKWS